MPLKRAGSAKEADAERPAPAIKRSQSSSKRKASESEASDTEAQPSASKTKKAKVSKPEDAEAAGEGVSANGQPTNKVLPVNIGFEPKSEGTLRIATWNICGLAAASKKVMFTLLDDACEYHWLVDTRGCRDSSTMSKQKMQTCWC